MKAAVLETCAPVEQGPLRLLDVPDPKLASREVRVRYCDVCHTDLHTVEGDLKLPKLPLIPGHQIAGQVEALGKKAERFRSRSKHRPSSSPRRTKLFRVWRPEGILSL